MLLVGLVLLFYPFEVQANSLAILNSGDTTSGWDALSGTLAVDNTFYYSSSSSLVWRSTPTLSYSTAFLQYLFTVQDWASYDGISIMVRPSLATGASSSFRINIVTNENGWSEYLISVPTLQADSWNNVTVLFSGTGLDDEALSQVRGIKIGWTHIDMVGVESVMYLDDLQTLGSAPTPTPTPTPTVSISPSPTPTVSVTPTPSASQSPAPTTSTSPSVSEEPTQTPTPSNGETPVNTKPNYYRLVGVGLLFGGVIVSGTSFGAKSKRKK